MYLVYSPDSCALRRRQWDEKLPILDSLKRDPAHALEHRAGRVPVGIVCPFSLANNDGLCASATSRSTQNLRRCVTIACKPTPKPMKSWLISDQMSYADLSQARTKPHSPNSHGTYHAHPSPRRSRDVPVSYTHQLESRILNPANHRLPSSVAST